MAFTTKDRDNDKPNSYNCAVKEKGAWWFKSFYNSHLNGNCGDSDYYLNWNYLKGSKMKLKPKYP